jgi:pimeloyl-ACP methyl ester carboxylesterase
MRQCAGNASLVLALLVLLSCAGDRQKQKPMTTSVSPLSKWCTIGGTRIHYIDTGECESGGRLLIVHGYLGSTVPFLELIDDLSADLRVVMPDLPAFGASEVPEWACTMEYYLDFLQGFSRAVGLDRYYLAGTSMGANIAVHYAVGHPGQVQGLILLSPFGLHDQDGRMTQVRRWDALLPLASSLITRRNVHRRLLRSIQNDDQISAELSGRPPGYRRNHPSDNRWLFHG